MSTKHISRAVIIFFGFFLYTSCKSLDGHSNSKTVEEYFKIEIIQDDEVIPILDNTVILKKEPFKFKVTLTKTTDIYVSASWDKYYFDYSDSMNIFECNDEQFKGCRFVAVKTGNQDKFNVNKDLAIGNGNYQWNWFYDESMDWHRFDSTLTVKDGVINASMSVENIYDCDGRDANLEKSEYEYTIENIDNDIYMVFATSHYERGMKHPEELQRERFKIQFRKQ
ncbi:MAG: hypothetical protein HRT58_03370 [Crocinitomicaceae bacterium]|nr:hypothetical protein [Crocinitomicaceae bacterium]